jgi:methyl-accepting chemotaxis protein
MTFFRRIFSGISSGIQNLSIFWKAALPLVASLALVLAFVALVLLPSLEQRLLEAKRELLMSQIESMVSLVGEYEAKAQSGELSTDEAQKQAMERLRGIRFLGKEYFYVYNLDCVCLMHPTAAKLVGKPQWELKDAKGRAMMRDITAIVRADGKGFLEYYFPKAGDPDKVPLRKLGAFARTRLWDWFVGTGIYIDDVESAIVRLRLSVFSGLAFAVVVAVALGFVFIRQIVRPVRALDAAARQMASGAEEIHLDIKQDNELGRLADSFNAMVATIREQFSELETEKANVEAKVVLATQQLQEEKNYLASRIDTILQQIEIFRQGNLTIALPASETGDIGRLYLGFNEAVAGLRRTMQAVDASVDATASASTSISADTQQMATAIVQQRTQMDFFVAQIDQSATELRDTTQKAVYAAQQAALAGSNARTGGVIIQDAISRMETIASAALDAAVTIEKLETSTEEIQQILKAIAEIAEQTNLLALNAAIEAARAGESGRGFAVVADEVRKLSERTQEATKQVASVMTQIHRDVASAMSAMRANANAVREQQALTQKAEQSLEKIIEATSAVGTTINELAAANETQSAGSRSMLANIAEIQRVVGQSADSASNIADAADAVRALAEDLKHKLDEFTV